MVTPYISGYGRGFVAGVKYASPRAHNKQVDELKAQVLELKAKNEVQRMQLNELKRKVKEKC